MTNLTNIRIKCTICGKEEIVSHEIVSEVSTAIVKYDLKPEKYLNYLNMMYGKCLDSDEHSFIFDETFTSRIDEIVEKHKNILAEIDSTKNSNISLKKEVEELRIKIEEALSKHSSNEKRILNLNSEVSDLQTEIGNAVGIYKVESWY